MSWDQRHWSHNITRRADDSDDRGFSAIDYDYCHSQYGAQYSPILCDKGSSKETQSWCCVNAASPLPTCTIAGDWSICCDSLACDVTFWDSEKLWSKVQGSSRCGTISSNNQAAWCPKNTICWGSQSGPAASCILNNDIVPKDITAQWDKMRNGKAPTQNPASRHQKPDIVEPPNGGKLGIVVGSIVGVVLIIAALIGVFFWQKHRRNRLRRYAELGDEARQAFKTSGRGGGPGNEEVWDTSMHGAFEMWQEPADPNHPPAYSAQAYASQQSGQPDHTLHRGNAERDTPEEISLVDSEGAPGSHSHERHPSNPFRD